MILVLWAVLATIAQVLAYYVGVREGKRRYLKELRKDWALVPKGELDEFKRKTIWLNEEYDRRLGELMVERQLRELR